MGKVAYILVCWNNQTLLDECIQSINAQTYPEKDIYLIDNNSSDGSVKYIEEHYPYVKLTKSSKNNGFARGNNILLAEALKDNDVGSLQTDRTRKPAIRSHCQKPPWGAGG